MKGPWPDDSNVKGPLSQVFMFAYVSDILLYPVFNLAPSKWPGVHGLPIHTYPESTQKVLYRPSWPIG